LRSPSDSCFANIDMQSLCNLHSISASTHEHHAGEFGERDKVIGKLRKQGFADDGGNKTHNAPDHKPKFFSKTTTNEHNKVTSRHSVMVNPDGSFTHSAELMNDGHDSNDIDHLTKTFQAMSDTRKTVRKPSEIDVYLLRLALKS
jgi:hypothetical protein